ncbi:MAG: VanW family protein [Lawsonibacter sp.]|nr:VanW family protein [Lawsonibacter sp.]
MEDQRMEKRPGAKKGLIIVGVIAVAAVAAYLGLCAWVGQQDAVLPNVSVAGLNVSEMSEKQAEQAIRQEFNSEKQADLDKAVELRCENYVGYLGGESFQVDAAACAQKAISVGRENFFATGIRYISHQLGSSQNLTMDDQVALSKGGQEELDRQIQTVDGAIGTQGDESDYVADTGAGILTMTKGRTHRAVDREAAAAAVTDAFSGILNGASGIVQLETVEQPPKEPAFDTIHSQVYAEVQDAHMDPETHEITEAVLGVDFDVAAAQSAFESAQEGKTFAIPLKVTQPKETKKSLVSKLFRDLLGQGTSVVGGTANRKSNVKLSAAACNGVILLPGEEFSYNGTTGSRSADKGYLPAPIYLGGKSEDDIGGGICQTSSTIYYAVLHTTLEVVERHEHKFAVGYVPDGMDATVFYGSLDFRFKNNTEYPVKVVTECYDKGGKRYLTVELYGTNANGRYGVPERTQFDWVTPTVQYVADDTVPKGTLVLDGKQNAYTGRKAHTYRNIYEKSGTLVEKQDMGGSKYDMRPSLYHYNPLDGDPSTWVDGVPPKPTVGTVEDEGTSVLPGTGEQTDGTGTESDTGAEEQPGMSGSDSAGTEGSIDSGEGNVLEE